MGCALLSLAAAPHLREGGAIVNVASIAGYGWRANLERAKALVDAAGFPETPDVAGNHAVNDAEGYPVSKEACCCGRSVRRISRCSRSAASGSMRSVPGPVATPILREFRAVFGDARVDSDIAAVGRAGTASDIAPAILFLCSDGARWINGANLPVDGGLEAAVNGADVGVLTNRALGVRAGRRASCLSAAASIPFCPWRPPGINREHGQRQDAVSPRLSATATDYAAYDRRGNR